MVSCGYFIKIGPDACILLWQAPHIWVARLFVQQFVRVNIENISVLHYWPIVRGMWYLCAKHHLLFDKSIICYNGYSFAKILCQATSGFTMSCWILILWSIILISYNFPYCDATEWHSNVQQRVHWVNDIETGIQPKRRKTARVSFFFTHIRTKTDRNKFYELGNEVRFVLIQSWCYAANPVILLQIIDVGIIRHVCMYRYYNAKACNRAPRYLLIAWYCNLHGVLSRFCLEERNPQFNARPHHQYLQLHFISH